MYCKSWKNNPGFWLGTFHWTLPPPIGLNALAVMGYALKKAHERKTGKGNEAASSDASTNIRLADVKMLKNAMTSAKDGGISTWSDGGFVRKLGGVTWAEFVLQGTSRVAMLIKKMNWDGRLAARHNAGRGF